MVVAAISFILWPFKTSASEPWITLSAAILWLIVYWKVFNLLWKVMIQIGGGRKKKSGTKKSKLVRGYRSPEEFHADFAKRYGNPGRVPEDVA